MDLVSRRVENEGPHCKNLSMRRAFSGKASYAQEALSSSFRWVLFQRAIMRTEYIVEHAHIQTITP